MVADSPPDSTLTVRCRHAGRAAYLRDACRHWQRSALAEASETTSERPRSACVDNGVGNETSATSDRFPQRNVNLPLLYSFGLARRRPGNAV
ncbi:hypothetical protein MRX96_010039 [Rhipicephalus microplus]